MTYLPGDRRLRWAYAGHPPAVWMHDGQRARRAQPGTPLGLGPDPDYTEGSLRLEGPAGLLLYTDGLTEARRDGSSSGWRASAPRSASSTNPSPSEAIAVLRARVADFAYGTLTDDLCMLAASIA